MLLSSRTAKTRKKTIYLSAAALEVLKGLRVRWREVNLRHSGWRTQKDEEEPDPNEKAGRTTAG